MIESDVLSQGSERVLLAAGGALSFAFGDVGPLLIWLMIFVVSDFVTGLAGAWVHSSYSSKRFFIGMAKKLAIFGLVALAHGLDTIFEPMIQIQVFQSVTICAYAVGEFGSIIENLERAGLGDAVPPVLRRLVKTLDERVETHATARLEEKGLRAPQKEEKMATERKAFGRGARRRRPILSSVGRGVAWRRTSVPQACGR